VCPNNEAPFVRAFHYLFQPAIDVSCERFTNASRRSSFVAADRPFCSALDQAPEGDFASMFIKRSSTARWLESRWLAGDGGYFSAEPEFMLSVSDNQGQAAVA
jgi:hypothetical protein